MLTHYLLLLARAVVKAPKFCHITPILRSLHWLKITERIEYKLLSLTYKMPLAKMVGLGPGNIVLDANPAPSPNGHSPQLSARICCGQMAARIKMSLGMELGLGPGDFVLDGDPAPPSP